MPCPLSLLLSFGLRCPGCLLRRPCCSSGGGNGGGSRAGSAEPLCCRSVAAAMPLCARLPFFCLFSCCSVSFFSLSLHSFFLSFYSFTSYTDPSRRACANALSLRLRGGHAKKADEAPCLSPQPACDGGGGFAQQETPLAHSSACTLTRVSSRPPLCLSRVQ